MSLLNVISAELSKLRTLPPVTLTAIGTVLLATTIAVSLAVNAGQLGEPLSAVDGVLQSVPFAQTGIILLGVLPSVHEHAGGQYRASLTVVPNRNLFSISKSTSALIMLAVTSILTIGVSLVGVIISQQLVSKSEGAESPLLGEPSSLGGATLYLILIGMLCHVVATLLHHLVAALVTMLTLVLIIPPLASVTEHARWLPSKAGQLLYLSESDQILTPTTGTLVLLGWILIVGFVALVSTHFKDA